MSRRIVMIIGLVASLAWIGGFGAYVLQQREQQANLLGDYVFDNCMATKHDIVHCFGVRDEAVAESKNGFPVTQVLLVLLGPVLGLWLIGWIIARLMHRRSVGRST